MSYKTALRRMARQTGELPHEFLLRVTRGEVIEQQVPVPGEPGVFTTELLVPDLPMRIDAAKSCAPFFAPKLSVQAVDVSGIGDLQDLNHDELQARLRVVMLQLSQVSPEAVAKVLPQLTGANTSGEATQEVQALLLQEAVLLSNLVREKEAGRKFFKMFPPPPAEFSYNKYVKHLEFFAAGKLCRERLFMAGNRVGKSEAGAYELVAHLTGEYPDWWEGRKFNKPIKCWVAGDTTKTVRDIIQAKLIGPPENQGLWGTGIVPKAALLLDKITRISGVANAIDSFSVQHKDGWVNTVSLKSYEQGRKSFQGTEIDIMWLDEEPPKDVYDECLLRTMTTNGMLFLTFTPLSGMTEVVMSYLGVSFEDASTETTKHVTQATWDDAPHLSDAAKAELWKSLPPHQRDARAKGIPTLGSGAIYPIAEDDILVDDFKIPEHWPRTYALDVGWNYTAMVAAARDLETQVTYIYTVYKRSQAEPLIHADAIKTRLGKIKGFIDPASRGRAQADGVQLYQTYTLLGLDLDFAVNAVESGLLECFQGLSTGKIKVFRSCNDFMVEYRLYRRDEKGRIVKANDHIMDAFRYVIMSGKRILSRPRRGFEPQEDLIGAYGEKKTYNDIQYEFGLSNSWLGA